eukprot:350700-Chlamydomonas_euryale.AAC.6
MGAASGIRLGVVAARAAFDRLKEDCTKFGHEAVVARLSPGPLPHGRTAMTCPLSEPQLAPMQGRSHGVGSTDSPKRAIGWYVREWPRNERLQNHNSLRHTWEVGFQDDTMAPG